MDRSNKSQTHVFICPQHWGLGHITRTIPIIQYFVENNYKVILGCSGSGSELLKKEFPTLKLYELTDYGITYPTANMYWNMGVQLIKMHRAIVLEKREAIRICKSEKIDLIVSDSRFGIYVKNIPSVIIAHHLFLPLGLAFFEWVSKTWMRFFYKQFDQVWIPDFETAPNLSGLLSHKYKAKNHFFIGPVSRFKKIETPIKYDIAFVLSGPEPQRTFFENNILRQLKDLPSLRMVLVRGVSQNWAAPESCDIDVINLATSQELNSLLNSSAMVVCRSGYTSLLDLSVLKKPALLIPTPGQPEQEYLAKELEKNKLFHCVDQDTMNLRNDLEKCKQYRGYADFPSIQNLDFSLASLLEKLRIRSF